MKRLISLLLILITLISCAFLCISCKKDDWRKSDINGYYTFGGGSMFSYTSWGLELYDERINDETKTFVVRYSADSYKNGVADGQDFYVSYGYYTIDKIYEGDDYIEYHLNLDYIVKDKNAPSWNTMTVTVKEDKISCIYNGHTLYKQ